MTNESINDYGSTLLKYYLSVTMLFHVDNQEEITDVPENTERNASIILHPYFTS